MKKQIIAAASFVGFILFTNVAFSAPIYRIERTIIPEASSTYDLGTSTASWRKGYFNGLRLVDLASGSSYCLTANAQGDVTTTTCGSGGTITGSGTSTQLAVFNTSSSITSYPSLTFNSASGTLTATRYALDGYTAHGDVPQVYSALDPDTGIHFAGPDVMAVHTSGNEVMNFTATGNVGVGTTTPAARLTVNGTVGFTTTTDAAFWIGSTSSPIVSTYSVNNGGGLRIGRTAGGSTGILAVDSANNLLLINGSGFTTIYSSNIVGGVVLGTTGQTGNTAKIYGSRNEAISSSTDFKADLNTSRDRNGTNFTFSGGDGGATNRSGGSVYLDGGSSTGSGVPGNVYLGMTFGNIGIGTTTIPSGSKLSVAGTSTLANLKVVGTTTLDVLDGILKGTSGVVGVAVSGTDYVAPTGSGQTLTLARIGNSTFKTIQDMVNLENSVGWVEGGQITQVNSTTVSVNSGNGFIRSETGGDAPEGTTSTLYFFNWDASSTVPVPADSTRYIGLTYNAGSPIITVTTTPTWDYHTNFPLGSVVNNSVGMHILFNPFITGDHAARTSKALLGIHRFDRDGTTGLMLGETGTRNVTVSSGAVWYGLTKFTIPALDTSVTSTFASYYRNGVGGFTATTSRTQWDNTLYDDGSGTLATMTVNRYANQWFYLEPDGELVSMFGRGQYATAAAAEAETPPTTLPSRLVEHGWLIGRIIFQKSASTATSIQSVYTQVFATSAGNDFLVKNQNLSDLNNTSTARDNLGLTIGTNVQAWNAKLDQVAAVATSTGNLLVASSTGWGALAVGTNGQVLESSSTAPRGVAWVSKSRNYPIQFIIENPSASENDSIFLFNTTSTVKKVVAVNKSLGDTVTWGLGYSNSRATATSSLFQLFSAAATTTATTTPVVIPINASSTPGELNTLTFWTTAASSSQFTLTAYYDEN